VRTDLSAPSSADFREHHLSLSYHSGDFGDFGEPSEADPRFGEPGFTSALGGLAEGAPERWVRRTGLLDPRPGGLQVVVLGLG